MASEADKKKAQELVEEADRLHLEAKTTQEKRAWAENTLAKMGEALELDPDNPEVWNNLGVANHELDNHQDAIDNYKKAIEIAPKYAAAWNNQGAAKNSLDDYRGAIDDCTKAIELEPKNDFAWSNRGLARYRLGKYEDALKDADEALRLNPKDEMLQRNRQAVLLAIEGEKRKGKTFEKERKHHDRLKEKAKDFRTKHDDCIQERNRLFRTIQKIIAGYILCLLIVIAIVFGPGWNFGDLLKHPFGLLPYFALLFIILSPFIWRISINTKEAERNLTLAEDYNGRLTAELYLERFLTEERDRREFAQKYIVYWMYNNPSETMIRLANKSKETPELPQVEQIRNFTKNTPTDPQS